MRRWLRGARPLAQTATLPELPPPTRISRIRSNISRLGEMLTSDFARSWAIGAWFVVPFAATGYVAEGWWGFTFQNAFLLALPVALLVFCGQAVRLFRSASGSDVASPASKA
jgi:hypothetical protein